MSAHGIPRSLSSAGTTLTVRGLYKSYGHVRAVHDVTLEIAAAEFVALLGPSGSGKTTILSMIAGFDTPDAGRIEIGNADVTTMPPARRGIGMVFQRYALFPHMTVAENIAFPLRMRGINGSVAHERIEEALALVRLAGYGARRTTQLSGGQQQRVALARALVYTPPLLLMDEPLGALDKNLREEMQLEIKHLQRRLGTTVVYVTHDQTEALTMADRIAVLSDGEVRQFDTPRTIYERPESAFVAAFLGENNFIDGTLALNDGQWAFAPAGLPQTWLQTDGAPGRDWVAGTRARLAVRPESIEVALGAGKGGLPGALEDVIYGGGTVACAVRLRNGAMLSARIASELGRCMQPGAAVRLSWPADKARVFVT